MRASRLNKTRLISLNKITNNRRSWKKRKISFRNRLMDPKGGDVKKPLTNFKSLKNKVNKVSKIVRISMTILSLLIVCLAIKIGWHLC